MARKKKENPTETGKQRRAVVIVPALNLRNGPGMNYEPVAVLLEDVLLDIVSGTVPGQMTSLSDPDAWTQVSCFKGTGWVKTEFIELIEV